ncbi:MAG: zf-TFIIB domain-containing protein [Candidatus Eremiobacteraeota bacterium]|nr:zf-TFIIB domain-containing protein [Candidatus Eremiobacteraeota bacterium]
MPIPPLVVAAGVALLGVLALADQTVSGIRRAQRGPARSHVAKVDPAVACPACERGMRKVTFHGVEIDECPFCAGQWFDAGEIETISQMDPIPKRFLNVFAIDGEVTRLPGERGCPRCQQELQSVELRGQSVDVCTTCQGVWLDRGEFKSVVK